MQLDWQIYAGLPTAILDATPDVNIGSGFSCVTSRFSSHHARPSVCAIQVTISGAADAKAWQPLGCLDQEGCFSDRSRAELHKCGLML